jgi:hypothetical protein
MSVSSADSTTRRIDVVPFDGKDFGLWRMRCEGLFMALDLQDVVETDVAERECGVYHSLAMAQTFESLHTI